MTFPHQFIVTGTDTGVGKTVLSALLMASLPNYKYWKPIQSGLLEETDSETVARLSECSPDRILPEGYTLKNPLSPHLSARLEGVTILKDKLKLPTAENLIVEGAGGIFVPINESEMMIDLFAYWNIPIIVACRSTLGTINHTLLTLNALRLRKLDVLGCVAIGEQNPENERAIATYGQVQVIGRIPQMTSITKVALTEVFTAEFDLTE